MLRLHHTNLKRELRTIVTFSISALWLFCAVAFSALWHFCAVAFCTVAFCNVDFLHTVTRPNFLFLLNTSILKELSINALLLSTMPQFMKCYHYTVKIFTSTYTVRTCILFLGRVI